VRVYVGSSPGEALPRLVDGVDLERCAIQRIADEFISVRQLEAVKPQAAEPVGEWRDWTNEECKQFEGCWGPGTMERRAYVLAVYTGQRLDLVGMAREGRSLRYFGAWFADAITAAKLPDDCVLHGLRKTAARRLAEADCSAHEITCVTGHTTTRMVEHYTKTADRKRGASAAILKLEKNAQ